MKRAFNLAGPPAVYVRMEVGAVFVQAGPTDQVHVEVTGSRAEEVRVEQSGDRVSIVGPRASRPGFGLRDDLQVRVDVPAGCDLVAATGSGDVACLGRLGGVRADVGSGAVSVEEITESSSLKTGSGDLWIRRVAGQARLQSGSGRIEVEEAASPASLSTGSGDLVVHRVAASVSLRSGSGSVRVGEVSADLELATASGDVEVHRVAGGRLSVKNTAGDVRVGIAGGVPVWTDVASSTGRVKSELSARGEPAPGQAYVELRVRTVTGDILLQEA